MRLGSVCVTVECRVARALPALMAPGGTHIQSDNTGRAGQGKTTSVPPLGPGELHPVQWGTLGPNNDKMTPTDRQHSKKNGKKRTQGERHKQ